ncbi:AAEL005288-PA [Aedes aegypti]|uniref:E3 ubiquitin-protein ligase KCMF1 n=2 Tax=Aedes aegypti TaxID=7159 RepID=A0A1S4FAE1_AEDAE|nr:E3 ubiquitin-protein ligase KCMF1 [Aedes aegypti]EAT43256.1 AAEL005288-PA [Aedes aegypti]
MNRIHPRITCDVCGRVNIVGTRYACLVCEEYDMCEMCFSYRCRSHQHKPYHPMQAILPEDEFFDSLRRVGPNELRIYCCPYCGEKGLSVTGMIKHLQRFHHFGGHPVRCPICLVYKMRNRHLLKTTLLQHLLGRHKEECVPRRGPPQAQCAPECSICMDPMTMMSSVRNLQCGHQFHSGCISNWLMNSSNCPLCRANVGARGHTIATIGYLEMF